ncbi:MAG: hypothetical protein FWD69_11720 [Polyangiaceae bacterium]|nr:hypothetical protein [Polyangiaceae bacterium]
MPRIELERVEQIEDIAQSSNENFDRMAFAERAVALVRPRDTTVAICPGSRSVKLEAGRQWGHGLQARWAVLTVTSNASRSAIARAVLGLHQAASPTRPYALDLLVAEAGLERNP